MQLRLYVRYAIKEFEYSFNRLFAIEHKYTFKNNNREKFGIKAPFFPQWDQLESEQPAAKKSFRNEVYCNLFSLFLYNCHFGV